MPLVKQFVTSCCQTGQCSSTQPNNNNITTTTSLDSDLNLALVALIHQLARVIDCCHVLFGELISDIELIQQRANKLHNKVTTLNNTIQLLEATTVVVPEGSVSDSCAGRRLVRRSSVTDYTSRLELRLFTRLSRPQSIVVLYGACQITPINIIQQCDSYRTDGQLGTLVFSVPIICLHQHIVDNVLNVGCVQSGRWRQPLGRSVKTLRPSNRTQQQQQQQQQRDDDDDVNEPEDSILSLPSTLPSQHHYHTLPSGLSGARSCFTLHTVPIDVSGLAFKLQQSSRSSTWHNAVSSSLTPAHSAQPTHFTNCKLSTWRRTVADISQLYDVTENKLRPQYLSTLHVSHDSNVGGVKSHGLAGRYCKWRQSVKSVFKAVTDSLLRPSKSRVELCTAADSTQHTNKHVTIVRRGPSTHNGTTVAFRRAYSLPRTLRATHRDLENTTHTSRSVEGELDITDGRSRNRPQSEHLMVSRGKDIAAPPTNIDQQLAPSANMKLSEDIVHVNIPEQPWTKPFADVKLRTKTTRVDANYRLSSGHWSCVSTVAVHQPTTTMSTNCNNVDNVDITDSAVSLNSNSQTDFRSHTQNTRKLSNEDSLTLKQTLSTITLNNNNNNNNKTVSTHSHVLQQVASRQVSLTTFGENKLVGNGRRVQVQSTGTPLPPTRVYSMTSQLVDTVISGDTGDTGSGDTGTGTGGTGTGDTGTGGTGNCSELEKLASLANKFVEHGTVLKTFNHFASTTRTSTNVNSTESCDVITCNDLSHSTCRQSPVISDSITAHLTCSTLPLAVCPVMSPIIASPVLSPVVSCTVVSPVVLPVSPGVSPVLSAGPQPVSARLIISSPVASRVQFIDNPHKRSVCQALKVPQDTSGLANSFVMLPCDKDTSGLANSFVMLACDSSQTVTSLQNDVSSSHSPTDSQQTVDTSDTLRNKVYVNIQQPRQQRTGTACIHTAGTTGTTSGTTGTAADTSDPSTHSLHRGHARVKYSPLGVQRLATQTDAESSQGTGITGIRTTVKLLKHKEHRTRRQVDEMSTVDDIAISRSRSPTHLNNSNSTFTTFTCNSLGRQLHSNVIAGQSVSHTLPRLNVLR